MPAIKGAGNFFQGLSTQASTSKTGQAFVAFFLAARHQQLQAHAQFSAPGDEPRTQEGKHHSGGHEHHAFRQGMQIASIPDIGWFADAGTDELICEAEIATECDGCGLLCDEGIGSAFDGKAILMSRENLAAESR